jgi:glycosyltransferase involved in cell wall biosynthesis
MLGGPVPKMSSAPHISVVMCVYNDARVIRETAQSVLSQEGVELEFIVVDDGSTDESARVLGEIAGSDARVRVIRQDNKGLTAGLIRGCEAARGRYIARQDAGDQSLPGRLRLQKMALDEHPGLSFVSCWTRVCGPEQEFLSDSKGWGRAETPTQIIALDERYAVIDGPSHHGSVMFRRDHYLACGGYRAQFYFAQDWDLWYRLGDCGKFQMLPQFLYQACVTPGSLSSRYRKEQRAIAELARGTLRRRRQGQSEDDLLELARGIRPSGGGRASAARLARGFYFIGEQLRRNGDRRAETYLRQALRLCPTMVSAWIRLGQFWLASKP